MKEIINALDELMLPCFYKSLLGIDCPGCGMQRSLLEMLKGNFIESFIQYPPLYFLLFFLGVVVLNEKINYPGKIILLKISALLMLLSVIVNYLINIL